MFEEIFINSDTLVKLIKISDKILLPNNQYIIKSYQKRINSKYYYCYTIEDNIYFTEGLTINMTELHDFKIIDVETNDNISSFIFDDYCSSLLKENVYKIYFNHLKNEKRIILNDIYKQLISRHKIIFKSLKKIFPYADFTLEQSRQHYFILKWNKLL